MKPRTKRILLYIIYSLALFGVFSLLHFASLPFIEDIYDSQNVFYMFSTAAQTVATFIAFLLAGYTLVHNIMDNMVQKDETLEDITVKLKEKYFNYIRVISVNMGVALLLDFFILATSRREIPLKTDIMVIAAFLNATVVVIGIWFVISIIDPRKYYKTALQMLREEEKDLHLSGDFVDEKTFVVKFIEMERELRDILTGKNIPIKGRYREDRFFSFRDMVETLRMYDLVEKLFYAELVELSKYRNLVFHGHKREVDKGMVERLERALEKVKELRDGINW